MQRLTKLQKGENVRLELSFFLASAGFAQEKRKKWLAEPKETLSVNGTAIYINNLQPEVHLMELSRPTLRPQEFKSSSLGVWPPSSLNAIPVDARPRKSPGVNQTEGKKQLLSPVQSRSSLDEPVGAPWACNG